MIAALTLTPTWTVAVKIDVKCALNVFPTLLILLTLSSASFGAEVFVWTDEEGNKHYGDKPPEAPGMPVTKERFDVHNVDRGYPYTDPDLYKNQTKSWSDKKKSDREGEQQTRKQRQLAMAAPCKKARQRLVKMQGRVTFHDDAGSQIETTERERQQAVIDLRAEIDRYCR
ncbi:MAG: hypothetical protein ACI8Z1_002257 [Candidatus Azotimanducaceae bacterium]|jgi:hypothetical protein